MSNTVEGINLETSLEEYSVLSGDSVNANLEVYISPITFSSPSPADGAVFNKTNVPLSIVPEVSAGGLVKVNFYNSADDSLIGSDTVTSGNTATVVWDVLTRGNTYSWYAQAEGYSAVSDTKSFSIPNILGNSIRIKA